MKTKIFKYKSASAKLYIYGDDTAYLSNVRSENRGRGHAAGLLEDICKFADKYGVVLTLMVKANGRPPSVMTNKHLEEFYGRYGFVKIDDRKPVAMHRRPAQNTRL